MNKKELSEYNWKGRIAISIVAGVGWIIFLIVWLFFFADGYSIYQNIAIFIVSLLIEGAIQGLVWIPWRKKWKQEIKK